MKILKLILKSRKLNFCKVFSLFLPLLSGVPHLYGLSLLSDLRSFHWSSHFPLVLSLLPGLTSSIRSYLFSQVLPLLPGLAPSLCSYPFSLVLHLLSDPITFLWSYTSSLNSYKRLACDVEGTGSNFTRYSHCVGQCFFVKKY